MFSGLRELFSSFSKIFQWWVVIAPWEQALRIRGGKRSTLLLPGVHLRIPFWDRIYRQSIRLRSTGTPSQTVATVDGFVVELRMVITYQIDDLEKVYQTLQSPENVLSALAAGAAARYINSRTLDQIRPAEIEKLAAEAITLEKFGLKSDDPLRVTDIAFVKRTYRLITGGTADDGYWHNINLTRPDERWLDI